MKKIRDWKGELGMGEGVVWDRAEVEIERRLFKIEWKY